MDTGKVILFLIEAQLMVSSVTVLSKLIYYLIYKAKMCGVENYPRAAGKVQIENTVYFNAHFFLIKKY